MQELYEKIGLFYLGKDADDNGNVRDDTLTLIKNKWLTTHALIIGMTGSGKTGLGISLIEEAALDNIPVVVIDPKGDMANVCFTDPEFRAESFEPWVKAEAEAKGVDALVLAKETAQRWKEGIEAWHQTSKRVGRFHRIGKIIYTPGSLAGVPVNILSSLALPPQEVMDDGDTFASYLKSTVTGLLSLIGEKTDAVESPAYILTAKIVADAWRRGEDMGIEKLIGAIISPPFERIGVLPLEQVFPPKARLKLANRLNTLLASPGFERWMQGDVLDMQRILYDSEGKAQIAVFSIAHLNDEERMFFVTLLLNRYIAWMRRQGGTSRLRAMLYMDEIYGFFPPNANPPSKEPMMLLLKQARAFGTGIVLSTQNPVDLDYKGLSNIGTWFVGRLQTKQDIARIIDGMQSSAQGGMHKEEIARILSQLRQRLFFLKSAHMPHIRLFSTRWVMSYLKGPVSKEEIKALMRDKRPSEQKEHTMAHLSSNHPRLSVPEPIDPSVPVLYEPPIELPVAYRPVLAASVSVRFVQQKRGLDKRRDMQLFLPLDETMHHLSWEEAYESDEAWTHYLKQAPSEATFAPLAPLVRQDKALRNAKRTLKNYLYTSQRLSMWRCAKLRMVSTPDEDYQAFAVRVRDVLEEKKEEEIQKLQERYDAKEKRLQERIARAQARVEKEKSDAASSLVETGIAILGALFGRTTSTKIGRTISKGSKAFKERQDITKAQEQLEVLLEKMDALTIELEEKLDALSERYDIKNYPVEEFYVTPRKSDIEIRLCALVWKQT